jgi:hypothetical protein
VSVFTHERVLKIANLISKTMIDPTAVYIDASRELSNSNQLKMIAICYGTTGE